ncbi:MULTISPECIES: tetratricopeptide repeat protein [Paenibacillus]|uniref:tetratricopeptide repeat protein n=1 Tax=Paenibacillus TaxID=44249 RepID=UPI0022B8BAFB|nr:tetratricopeptide repeat protein [Paenibacillus caseinilyticus]MCZ8520507.1 tetratricopeptide repeat protein [Paenibacillus caseinilyticus]
MDGETAIRKAYESILKHDFEQAVAWFEKAIALDPAHPAYHYKLSITYARSNKLEKAIEHAQQAVALDGHDEHYAFHLQHLQAKRLLFTAEKLFDEPEERLWMAVELLKQAVELDPLSVEGFLLLGMAYHRLGEYAHSLRSLKELLKLDPQHAIGRRLYADYEQKWKQYMKNASPRGMQPERNENSDE